MAAPNMLALTQILGETDSIALSTAIETQLLSNAAASGQVIKVNAIYASNIDTTTAYNISLYHHNAAAIGGTAFSIASTVSVPANSTVILVDKDANLYLTENTSLGVTASLANKLTITVSYEICS